MYLIILFSIFLIAMTTPSVSSPNTSIHQYNEEKIDALLLVKDLKIGQEGFVVSWFNKNSEVSKQIKGTLKTYIKKTKDDEYLVIFSKDECPRRKSENLYCKAYVDNDLNFIRKFQ